MTNTRKEEWLDISFCRPHLYKHLEIQNYNDFVKCLEENDNEVSNLLFYGFKRKPSKTSNRGQIKDMTFINCRFDSCMFNQAFFYRCNFIGCYMEFCKFKDTIFSYCNIINTRMESNFNDSEFSWCDLYGSRLYDFSFKNTILRECSTVNVKFLSDSLPMCRYCPDIIDAGIDCRNFRFIAVKDGIGGYTVHAGCRNFSRDEAIAHWGIDRNAIRAENRNESLEKMIFIENVAKLRGWIDS